MISVCMATYNGARYLKEQVDSILLQLSEEDELIVSDDNSSDTTLAILQGYKDERIKIFSNSTALHGVVRNFENAIKHAQGNYIFLADQDDVWLPDKVAVSLQKLCELELKYADTPVLVFSDATVVDEHLHVLADSTFALNKCNPALAALPQKICVVNQIMGCTMAFNKRAKEILLPIAPEAVMHDWWIALCVSKHGVVEPLQKSTLWYRQHAENMVGSSVIQSNSFFNKILNVRRLWNFNKRIYAMARLFYPISWVKFCWWKICLHL